MNDYYIGVDQNGQPYISHANTLQAATASVRSAGAGLGRGVRRYHKYLMKIGEGTKARYLYTQQEVQAYMRGGRKALDQMAKNTKENARKGLTAASDKAKTTGKNVKNKASDAVDYAKENSRLLNVGNQYNAAKRAHEFAKSSNPVTAQFGRKGYADNNTLGGKVYKTQQAVKEKIGNDARKDVLEKKADLERAKRLTKESRERHGSEDGLTKGFSKMVREREKQLNAAERKYDKTLLGKAEGTADKAKETGKSAISNVKSAPDRMKEEFRKKKDEAVFTVNSVKSKAEERADKSSQAMRSKAQDAEDSINSARDKAKGAFDEGKSRVKDSVKSTSDRMKEEFRKKKDETKEKASNTVNKVKKNLSNEPPKPVLSPVGKEHIETEHIIPEKKIEETRIPEKKIEETRIPEKRLNSKAKYSEYKDDDPDFDENNYSENDRVGDTDFFAFKGADGRTVIIEEDMKWTLPKGVEPDDPAIKEAINKFADEVTSARSLNMGNYTGDQWTKGATDAINDAIEKAQKRNKKS